MSGFDLHMPKAHTNFRVILGPKTVTEKVYPDKYGLGHLIPRLSDPTWSHREEHRRFQVPSLTPSTSQRDETDSGGCLSSPKGQDEDYLPQ